MPSVASPLQLSPHRLRTALPALLLILAGSIFPSALQAQVAFSPDRPGLGTGASIVPRGHVMIELGLPALEQERYPGSTLSNYSFPTLVRVGVTRRVELRLASPFFQVQRDDQDPTLAAEGFGDLEVGAKISMSVEQPFFVTDVALMPSLTLPIGEDAFAADGVGASLSALGNWLGWWTIGFGTTSGVAVIPVGDDYRLGGLFALSASHAPLPWLSLFVEAAYYPVNDLVDTAYAGGGLTLTPLSNVQLDAYFDVGLNEVSTDYLFGAGLAFQL